MVKVVWTDQAILDLDDIGDYIAKDSLKYAKSVAPGFIPVSSIV